MLRLRYRTSMICCLWLLAMMIGFFLGLRKSHAVPACTVCQCKPVFTWFAPNFPQMDIDGKGAKIHDTNTGISYAVPSILAATGCQTGSVTTNGKCDLWNFDQTDYVCSQAGRKIG